VGGGPNLEHGEEQDLLRGTARRFLDRECDSRFVRKCLAEPAAVTDEFWQRLAAQGWLGIVYPELDGGSGLGLVDLVVLMEEMGRRLMPGPFLSTVLHGGAAIAEAGSPAQRRQWLPRIAAGEIKAALAWTEPICAGTPPASTCRRAPRAAGSGSPAESSLSAMRISPTSSSLRRAAATAARPRSASACF
jgi:alkylation response protein AidB-like acyl-CoA dehydrogenase